MKYWKKIKERIYRISPTYRLLRKVNLKLNNIQESQNNNILQFEVHNFSKAQEVRIFIKKILSEPKLLSHLDQIILENNHSRVIQNVLRCLIKDEKYLLFDIGCNKGRFINEVLKFSNNILIACYEVAEIYRKHLEEMEKKHKQLDFYFYGLGDNNTKGKKLLNICKNQEGLSSFLKLNSDYQYNILGDKIISDKQFSTQEEAYISTLDYEFFNNKTYSKYDNIMIKIDVQGFEKKVLEGAKKLFDTNKIKIVFIEIMLIDKYKGQAKYTDIINFLDSYGYVIFDIFPFYREEKGIRYRSYNGILTECDFVFIKKDLLNKFVKS